MDACQWQLSDHTHSKSPLHLLACGSRYSSSHHYTAAMRTLLYIRLPLTIGIGIGIGATALLSTCMLVLAGEPAPQPLGKGHQQSTGVFAFVGQLSTAALVL